MVRLVTAIHLVVVVVMPVVTVMMVTSSTATIVIVLMVVMVVVVIRMMLVVVRVVVVGTRVLRLVVIGMARVGELLEDLLRDETWREERLCRLLVIHMLGVRVEWKHT